MAHGGKPSMTANYMHSKVGGEGRSAHALLRRSKDLPALPKRKSVKELLFVQSETGLLSERQGCKPSGATLRCQKFNLATTCWSWAAEYPLAAILWFSFSSPDLRSCCQRIVVHWNALGRLSSLIVLQKNLVHLGHCDFHRCLVLLSCHLGKARQSDSTKSGWKVTFFAPLPGNVRRKRVIVSCRANDLHLEPCKILVKICVAIATPLSHSRCKARLEYFKLTSSEGAWPWQKAMIPNFHYNTCIASSRSSS